MGSTVSTAQPKEGQSSGNRDAAPAVRREKDHASEPTKDETEKKERQDAKGQDAEGGHEDDCFHGKHCQWCSLFPGQI